MALHASLVLALLSFVRPAIITVIIIIIFVVIFSIINAIALPRASLFDKHASALGVHWFIRSSTGNAASTWKIAGGPRNEQIR